MSAITYKEFIELAKADGPCISIYLPIHASMADRTADYITISHAIDNVQNDWLSLGYPEQTIQRLLIALPDVYRSKAWQSRNPSLAILLSTAVQKFIGLPKILDAQAIVGDRMYLRPLVPWLVPSDRFFLLALSENRAQLYLANSSEIQPVSVPGMPINKLDSLQQDEVERIRCVTSAGVAGSGRQSGHYHGQGGRPGTDKAEMHEYVTRIAKAVDSYLHDETCPLVLATTKWTNSEWKECSHYRESLEAIVTCCPDHMDASALHQAAWPLVFDYLQAKQHDAYVRHQRHKNASLTIDEMARILPAALAGKVDSLLVESFAPIRGHYETSTGKVEFYSDPLLGEKDLLDWAIVETILHGGQVVPGVAHKSHTLDQRESSVHALLRY